MVEWKQGDVVANGIRLHYYRTGGNYAPVVLVHGITDNGLCWPRVAQALAVDHQVISYDARCHGLSEVPRSEPTWQDLADDLAAFIQVLGLEKPHVLGHSMGGATVSMAAAQHPDLFASVVLSDPAWGIGFDDPKEREETMQRWRQDIIKRRAMSMDELIALGREQSPAWHPDELEPWAQSKLQVDPSAAMLIGSEQADWQALARVITCPALLLWADTEKGSIISQEMAEQALRLLPQGKAVHISDSGHNIRREQFQAFMDAVTAFWAV